MVMSYGFWNTLHERANTAVVSLPTFKEPGLKLEFESCEDIETVYKDKEPPLPFACSEIYQAKILSWRRLTAVDENCKAVYEITFDVKDSNFQFKAGDTVGIIPHNRPEEVDTILEHLGIAAEAELRYSLSLNSGLKGVKIPTHIPVKSTLRHVLTHCVDFRSVLKKLFILALSRHTKCDRERKSLEYLSSKEGATLYTEHILNKSICVLDIFTIFKTCKPPIEILLAHLPRLLPRPYSIVNSGLKTPDILKICFSVMDIGNSRRGLVTGALETLLLNTNEVQTKMERLESDVARLGIRESCINIYGDGVPMYHRKNMADFSLPSNIKSHLIMIATGTGVAPFIGFLEEREMQREARDETGEAWLFFGCRNPDTDFIYREELEDSRVLNKMITAFSKIKSVEPRRIQNVLCDNGKEIAKLIQEGASIYVCGEAKLMVSQVRECIIGYLVKYSGKSQEEAEGCVAQMEKDKRYVVDLWN